MNLVLGVKIDAQAGDGMYDFRVIDSGPEDLNSNSTRAPYI